MKYLLLVFVLGFISSVNSGFDVTTVPASSKGQESIQCMHCQRCPEPDTHPTIHSCPGSCVKSVKYNVISKGCSDVSLITKCDTEGNHITVCACDSDYCNKSSKTRMPLFELLISCLIFLRVAIIFD
ncbi:uncharacterized protein LOC132725837 [Ruditapes philippinarum]|uniref:uncharacterized protein LOC132725837 n=1 Tax=Ruditapes philippinarum TaxID=129788 RepID=UPI00295B156A|nr:uncharacterized protein LOC132725837 [Ruditapes philippinarum]